MTMAKNFGIYQIELRRLDLIYNLEFVSAVAREKQHILMNLVSQD
jgi:hypothetical protein